MALQSVEESILSFEVLGRNRRHLDCNSAPFLEVNLVSDLKRCLRDALQ